MLISQLLYVFVVAPYLVRNEANKYLLQAKEVRLHLNQNMEDAARDNYAKGIEK